jgi:hypothetical protein
MIRRLRHNGRVVRLKGSAWWPAGGALVGVSPLGVANDGGRPRGVIGIFLDTNDGAAFDWGVPGTVGSISADQIAAAERAVEEVRANRSGPYRSDPAYVVFSHIPYRDLARASRGRVDDLVKWLDDSPGADGGGPRVLALVAAHKHMADAHRHCIARRVVREIIIGSTIDPPQQAALVDIGADAQGRLALGLHTLQTVGRPDATCPGGPARVSAAVCRTMAAEISKVPACAPLFAAGPGPGDLPARACEDIERPRTLAERLAALRTFAGPRSADERRALESRTAKDLLACLCRDGSCRAPADPFAGEAHAPAVAEAFSHPGKRDELVCLAWAASAMQQHRAAGMTLPEALRCSFDDPTTPAERVSVATLESARCF